MKDPTRRRIIEILGKQEKIGFKELRKDLGLGVGTVYYHLDMLSDFLTQDKQHKYRLNDRGKILLRSMEDGNIPASLEIGETANRHLGKWLFLSPAFSLTVKPLRLLPVSIAILFMGALGSSYARLDSALFFYFQYSARNGESIIALYLFNWIGLFLFTELFTYVVYIRVGNDLQLFTCLGVATFLVAAFPYVCLLTSDIVSQYVLIALQIWSLLLVSAAFCFGKGIRLDKAIVVSLTAMYLNIAVLFVLGRFQ